MRTTIGRGRKAASVSTGRRPDPTASRCRATISRAREVQPGAPDELISGRNLTAHWTHDFADGSSLQFLTYYDREARATEDNGGNFWVDTYDFEVQHNFAPNGWNAINWGGGLRVSDYNIHGNASLLFVPESRALDLSDIFAQDSHHHRSVIDRDTRL